MNNVQKNPLHLVSTADFVEKTIRLSAPSPSCAKPSQTGKRFENITHQKISVGSGDGSIVCTGWGRLDDGSDMKSELRLRVDTKSATSSSHRVRLGEQEEDGSKLHV